MGFVVEKLAFFTKNRLFAEKYKKIPFFSKIIGNIYPVRYAIKIDYTFYLIYLMG